MIDVVIPARNEVSTIGKVVKAFAINPLIGNVIVVSNKSDDGTQDEAQQAGAFVLVQNKVDGKGQTVRVGLDYVETLRVIFCDGDLYGPVADYVGLLAAPDAAGMVVGVPDVPARSPVPWPVPPDVWPLVSGQRSLPTHIARGLDLHGYAMEVQINRAIHEAGLPTSTFLMTGVYGKIRNNEFRMAELRRDREWLKENW